MSLVSQEWLTYCADDRFPALGRFGDRRQRDLVRRNAWGRTCRARRTGQEESAVFTIGVRGR
jgi:hypothetical protein